MSLLRSSPTPSTEDEEGSPASVLILGGWSPGPLPFLRRSFQRRCIFHEPSIPMPPVGFSWCCDPSFILLIVVLACASYASVSIKRTVSSGGWLIVMHMAVVLVAIVAVRLCVAGVVRGSVSKGIAVAERNIRAYNVDIVVGFSWGGSIAAEMIRLGLLGARGQPSVLMIAPTTALVAAIAMKVDPAKCVPPDTQQIMGARVHVFHATDDRVFCPHCDRWERSGVSLHMCQDNHVFCRRSSLQAICTTFDALMLQQSRNGRGES